jgi:hypothetical protein
LFLSIFCNGLGVQKQCGGREEEKPTKTFIKKIYKKKKQGRWRGTRLKYVLTTYMLIYLVNNYFSGGWGGGGDIGKSQTKSTNEAPKSISF